MPPKKANMSTTSRPSYKDMICEALLNLKDRNGSSRIAICNYLVENYKVNKDTASRYVGLELKKGKDTLFAQNKQSFRIMTNQRRVAKQKMKTNKRTSKFTAAKTTHKNRPIKKWLMEVFTKSPTHTLDELVKTLVKTHNILESQETMFQRTLKAVLSRGVKEEVWTLNEDESYTIDTNSLVENKKTSKVVEEAKDDDATESDEE